MEQVKISYCQNCGGYVRVAILEHMNEEIKKEMGIEAVEYDLRICSISRQEYESDKIYWCKCIK